MGPENAAIPQHPYRTQSVLVGPYWTAGISYACAVGAVAVNRISILACDAPARTEPHRAGMILHDVINHTEGQFAGRDDGVRS